MGRLRARIDGRLNIRDLLYDMVIRVNVRRWFAEKVALSGINTQISHSFKIFFCFDSLRD